MNSDGIIWSALAAVNTINLIAYVQRISRADKPSKLDLFFVVLSAAMLIGSAWQIAAGL